MATSLAELLGLAGPRLLPLIGAAGPAVKQPASGDLAQARAAAQAPSVLPKVGAEMSQPADISPAAMMDMGGAPALLPAVGGAPPQVTNPLREARIAAQDRVDNDLTPRMPFHDLSGWGKVGRVLGTIGDVAGTVFAPEATVMIPGSSLNRAMRTRNDFGALRGLSGLENQAETQARGEEEVGLRRQQLGEEQAARQQEMTLAEQKANAPEWQHLVTDQGMFRYDAKSGKLEPLTYNGKALMGATAQKEQTPQQAAFDAYVAGGMTPQQAYEKIREKPPGTAGGAEDRREGFTERQEAYKTYQPAMDSAERFNVMATNYEEAVKNHDQQAMLSLLANHLGMTMGLQKGARMTRDIIREAQQSRPWLQGMQAQFDKDGYLSGVTLTAPQMRQMVGLAQERYGEDVRKARSEANYLGAKGDGPAREPGEATVRYYTALAGGDPAKAKALAAADGWTMQPEGK